VKNRHSAALLEMYPAPDELIASGPEGRFVHELIVPFVTPSEHVPGHVEPRPRLAPARSRAEANGHPASVRRIFPPGSDWLYAKIYTGTSTADGLLTEFLGPVVRHAMESGAADRWFFIRYGDPEWHIRLRLHGIPARLTGEVLPALHAALAPAFDDGRLWRLQLDTYEREIERYGGPEAILVAEEVFHADSEVVLDLLGMLEGDSAADARWRLALWGIDRLLDDLGMDAVRKLGWAKTMKEGSAQELRIDKGKRIRLGAKFRKERNDLEALFLAGAEPDGADHDLAPGLAALRAATPAFTQVGARLRDLSKSGRMTVSLEDMAASLVHMRVNRLLRSAQRAQEAVFYDFLERIYEGRAARQKPRLEPTVASEVRNTA